MRRVLFLTPALRQAHGFYEMRGGSWSYPRGYIRTSQRYLQRTMSGYVDDSIRFVLEVK